MGKKIGEWAYLVGLVLALVFGFIEAGSWQGILTLVLVIAGLVIGFLNITEKETTPFLIASVALIATGTADLTIIPAVGQWLQNIVDNIAVLVTPAAIVVALKTIKSLAKS